MRKALIAFAFYALLALIALYNPIFHLNTHVPGDPMQATDYYHFHWNFWWMRHALAAGQSIYLTDAVFAPFTSNLAYHTLTAFWFPVWALIEPFAGTVTAMTVIMALALALTGWTFYLLLRREGVKTGWALAFGAILQFSPLMLNSLFWTNINLMSLFWLPALILLWGETARCGWRWALVFGAALYAVIMTDPQLIVLAAPLVLPYGVWTLVRARHPLRVTGRGLLAVALALSLWYAAGSLPYILSYDRSTLSPTPLERAVSIPFPLGYVSRLPLLASFGALPIPLIGLALVAAALTRRKLRGVFWLIIAVPPLILTAGGFAYQPLHDLLGGMFRYPERFAPAALIAGLIFAGKTLSQFRAHWGVGAALVMIVVAEARIFAPQPIQSLLPAYAFHHDMGREPYAYVVLDVPTGGGSGEGIVGNPRWLITQFYALTHGKQVVNGHLSRVNTWHYMVMETADPLLAWLGGRRFLDAAAVEAELRQRITNDPIGYIVIHADLIERNTATLQEIIGYFNQLDDLLCFHTVEGDAIVYRTRWHPDGCAPRTPPEVEAGVYRIDIGSAGDQAYIGWGYHWAESVSGLTLRWTGEYPQTDTYIDVPPGTYDLSVTMQAFWEDRRVALLVNGVDVGDPVNVSINGLADYAWRVPADVIGDGRHVQITLVYDDVIIPREVGQSGDSRRLAVAVDALRLRRL